MLTPVHLIFILLLAALFVLPAVAGYKVGLKRRHEVAGIVLGVVFSWLGVLIIALFPKRPPLNEWNAFRGDIAAQLEHLSRLRDNGALTEDEFAAAKARALGTA
jgi:hypothetical protein